MYCYHYDPKGGKYVLIARRVMQVGAGGVAVVLFGILGLFWGRELRKGKKDARLSAGSPSPADVPVPLSPAPSARPPQEASL